MSRDTPLPSNDLAGFSEQKFRSLTRTLRESEEPDITLAEVDKALASQVPAIKSMLTRQRWLWGIGIGLSFGAVAGVAAFMGAPTGMSSDGLSEETALVVAPWCVLIGIIGLVWSLAIWVRRGRPKFWWETTIVSVALVSNAGVLAVWLRLRPVDTFGWSFGISVASLGVLVGVAVVGWRLLGGTNKHHTQADAEVVAQAIRHLPTELQQNLRTQRDSVLLRLATEDVITDSTRVQATSADWGGLWQFRTIRAERRRR